MGGIDSCALERILECCAGRNNFKRWKLFPAAGAINTVVFGVLLGNHYGLLLHQHILQDHLVAAGHTAPGHFFPGADRVILGVLRGVERKKLIYFGLLIFNTLYLSVPAGTWIVTASPSFLPIKPFPTGEKIESLFSS